MTIVLLENSVKVIITFDTKYICTHSDTVQSTHTDSVVPYKQVLVPLFKALLSVLFICMCLCQWCPLPPSHFTGSRLLRVGCGPHVTVTLSSLSPSIHLSHPVPCPPVIPDLPVLTYVTRPHPRACGLKARIDRLCFTMTAAHGLCEKGGV